LILAVLKGSQAMAGMLRKVRARVREEASVIGVVRPVLAISLSIVLSSLMLSGCADSPGGPIPYNVSNFGVPDSPELVPLEAGYKIAPMDTLTVKVFKMPDLSGIMKSILRATSPCP
jgi:polysaccharide export outer membrane protein